MEGIGYSFSHELVFNSFNLLVCRFIKDRIWISKYKILNTLYISNQFTNSYFHFWLKNESFFIYIEQSSHMRDINVEESKLRKLHISSSYLNDLWGYGCRIFSTWILRHIYTNSMVEQNQPWVANLILAHICSWTIPILIITVCPWYFLWMWEWFLVFPDSHSMLTYLKFLKCYYF